MLLTKKSGVNVEKKNSAWVLRFFLSLLTWIFLLNQGKGATLGEIMKGVPLDEFITSDEMIISGYQVYNKVKGRLYEGGIVASTAYIKGERLPRKKSGLDYIRKPPHRSTDIYVLDMKTACYLAPSAWVIDTARIDGHVRIHDYAQVSGTSQIYGRTQIAHYAKVHNSIVSDDVCIFENAIVDESELFGNIRVCGTAIVHDSVFTQPYLWIGGKSIVLSFNSASRTRRIAWAPEETPKDLPLNPEDQCPICLLSWGETSAQPRLQLTHCKHLLHHDCLRQWLTSESQGRTTCPVCRQQIQIEDLKKLKN